MLRIIYVTFKKSKNKTTLLMNDIRKCTWLLNLVFFIIPVSASSQVLFDIGIEKDPKLNTDRIILSDSTTIRLPQHKPLFSFYLNEKYYNS